MATDAIKKRTKSSDARPRGFIRHLERDFGPTSLIQYRLQELQEFGAGQGRGAIPVGLLHPIFCPFPTPLTDSDGIIVSENCKKQSE
jgi:hypothetical protein